MQKPLRIVIVRTMPNFSMHVYADGVISGLRAIRPDWEIVDLAPQQISRHSRSPLLRVRKAYERFWTFPRKIAAENADIFHIIDHTEAHIVYWLEKLNKPTVVTCHDLINFLCRDNLKGSVKLPIISHRLWEYSVKGVQCADHAIAVSQTTAKDMTDLLKMDSKQISVIPNAVDTDFQIIPTQRNQKFRSQKNVSDNTIVLLNVGSNHPRKNIQAILRALVELREKEVNIRFWKVGSNFTEEQQVFINDHHLNDITTYLDQPSRSDLIEIYNAADILLAPSTHEGFGLTILEAMACGTPVITSNVSAMPEVAADAAVLVDPRDARDIVAAILKIKRDSNYRQNLVAKGLARAHTFTWVRTAQKIADVYEKVVYGEDTEP